MNTSANAANAANAVLIRRRFSFKRIDLMIATIALVIAVAAFAPIALPAAVVHWMAAVTIVARSQKFSKTDNRWIYEYSITGVSTNTLDTPVNNGKRVKCFVEPCPITAIAQSAVNGKVRLTFTSTGAFTAVGLLVYVG